MLRSPVGYALEDDVCGGGQLPLAPRRKLAQQRVGYSRDVRLHGIVGSLAGFGQRYGLATAIGRVGSDRDPTPALQIGKRPADVHRRNAHDLHKVVTGKLALAGQGHDRFQFVDRNARGFADAVAHGGADEVGQLQEPNQQFNSLFFPAGGGRLRRSGVFHFTSL